MAQRRSRPAIGLLGARRRGGTVIEARDLSFTYPRGDRAVLRGVSITLRPGAIVGLLGPNGCGKTTLLRLLGGMLTPQAGEVRLGGGSLAALSRRDIARRVAVVPQETHATFDFTVMDIVLMGRYPHLGPFEMEGPADLAIARQALDATGTAHLAARPFSSLSGGEKQRVVIAGALAQQAEVMLLDEPTASLDLAYQLEVASLLRGLNRKHGTTMAVCTHDLNMAAALCDEVVLLRDGEVLARGATADTITVDNIRSTYGVAADVRFHPGAGHLAVVPIARTS
jgi:iron complex transport system ATP-binding protein